MVKVWPSQWNSMKHWCVDANLEWKKKGFCTTQKYLFLPEHWQPIQLVIAQEENSSKNVGGESN